MYVVLTAPNNYIFKERLKEVLTIKALSESVENFRQTKLRIAARVFVIILHVKGKISKEAVSWQYYFNSL